MTAAGQGGGPYNAAVGQVPIRMRGRMGEEFRT